MHTNSVRHAGTASPILRSRPAPTRFLARMAEYYRTSAPDVTVCAGAIVADSLRELPDTADVAELHSALLATAQEHADLAVDPMNSVIGSEQLRAAAAAIRRIARALVTEFAATAESRPY